MSLDQKIKDLRHGDLDLEHQDLDHKDLKRILTKLGSGRTQPSRKCRRLNEDLIGTIESRLSSAAGIQKLRLSGNKRIGDKGTDYVHLLPDTVKFINLSFCGLSTKGVQKICKYLETNTSIIGVMMWGNCIDDEGAKHIAKMLEKNTTLVGLSCRDLKKFMTVDGINRVAKSLKKNHSLRVLDFGHNTDGDKSMEPSEKDCFLPFEAMLEKNENSALKRLVVCGKNECDIGGRMNIKYFMDLNNYKARDITRDENIERFQAGVEKAAHDNLLDVTYYFIRNNVQHILK